MKGITKIDFLISYLIFLCLIYFLTIFFMNFLPDIVQGYNIVKAHILFDYISKIDCKLCYVDNKNVTYYMIFDYNKLKNLDTINCSEFVNPYNGPFYLEVKTKYGTFHCNGNIPSNSKIMRYVGIIRNNTISQGEVYVYI